MESVLIKCHELGCSLASIWDPKGKLLAGDPDFKMDSGELMSVIRLFKSKAPATRIANNNHVVQERKTGKMPFILASCVDFGTNVVLIDCRKCVIVGLYEIANKSEKDKRTIHEKMEELGTEVMNKK